MLSRMSRAHLLLALLFGFFYLPFILDHGWYAKAMPNVDFPSFQLGATLAFSGHSPYDFEALQALAAPLHQLVYPFLYPPNALLLLAPLAQTDYATAKEGMLLANHLMALLCFLLLTRVLWTTLSGPEQRPTRPLFVAGWIVYFFHFTPVYDTLSHGQVNLMVLAALCIFWSLLRAERSPFLTGGALAVAVVLKTYPLLFLPWLVVRKQYRVLGWTVAFLGVSVGLSMVLLPPAYWVEWLTVVAPSGGYGRAPTEILSPASPWNQSLNGFFSRLFLPNPFSDPLFADLGSTAGMLARVLPYAVALPLLWKSYRACGSSDSSAQPRVATLDLEFGLLLLTIYLLAPLSWEHHQVTLLPALLVLPLALLEREREREQTESPGTETRRWSIVLFACFAMIPAQKFLYASQYLKYGFRILLISIPLYAVVGLWTQAYRLLRQRRAA